MNLDKLFQVLVVGGALIAGAGCSDDSGPVDEQTPIDASSDAMGPDATPIDAAPPDAAAEVNYCGCAGQPGDCSCGTTPCCWLVYAPCCDECPE